MLNICRNFFEYLNGSGIRYCHWKSNFHLDKALSGRTDLDVLVHPDDYGRFREACVKFDLKKVLSPPLKRFEGLEDYLGFDRETGALIHLHVHYKLVLGQRFIKNHHLPLEEMLLNNLVMNDCVAVPVPEIELMLLIIRAHMKLDALSLLKHGIRGLQGKYYSPFPDDIVKEMGWLIGITDPSRFRKMLSLSGLPVDKKVLMEFIEKFSGRKFACLDAIRTRRRIFSSLSGYRRRKDFRVFVEYMYLNLLNSRLGWLFARQAKKTLKGRGRIFSLVGADGSGKSTLIGDLEKWLSWKLMVKRYYYGIPKTGTVSFVNFLVRISRKFYLEFVASCIECFLWSMVAMIRHNVFLSSLRDRNSGAVVLTDRFPLKQFQTMEAPMDGPRLAGRKGAMNGYFADMEADYYDRIELSDRIFVLQVDIDELRRRKTDLGLGNHKMKAEAVNGISGDGVVATVNANRTYAEVRLEIQSRIWEAL